MVVKAGYLVPQTGPIANPNLMALTDGAVNQDIEHLSSRHRVPTYPFVRDLRWSPTTIVSALEGLTSEVACVDAGPPTGRGLRLASEVARADPEQPTVGRGFSRL